MSQNEKANNNTGKETQTKSNTCRKGYKREYGNFLTHPLPLSDFVKEGRYISTKQKRQIELLKIMIINL